MTHLAGQQFYAGSGISTVLPDMDFETFSAAGYVWTPATGKWANPKGATKKGLFSVGAAVYARHPTCEALCFAYDLKDGKGRRRWRPGQPNPIDLFLHLARGGLVEAWNVGFELWVWNSVNTRRYGWPPLNPDQTRCAMAKARAHGLPGGLDAAAAVLGLDVRKNSDGTRLIEKFSNPRNPTKKDPRIRIRMEDDPVDAEKMCDYNEQDIVVEAEASIRIPDLPPAELEFWQAHERINRRGIQIDREAVTNAITIMESAFDRYNTELSEITGGVVSAASQLARLKEWLHGRGVHMDDMDEDAIDAVLPSLPAGSAERRALEIRQRVGSAAVKKLYAFDRYADPETGRVYDGFVFHSAHTGRSCIAEGQPVLVKDKVGNVLYRPIEDVLIDDLLWDGLEWVAHEGVVAAGVKPVIEHDGVEATLDHRVFISTSEYARMDVAAKSGTAIYRGEVDCPTPSIEFSSRTENPI